MIRIYALEDMYTCYRLYLAQTMQFNRTDKQPKIHGRGGAGTKVEGGGNTKTMQDLLSLYCVSTVKTSVVCLCRGIADNKKLLEKSGGLCPPFQ